MSDKYIIFIAFALLLIQGSWIFYDASKKGLNKWIWGLFGMVQLPSSLIIYLLITRVLNKKITCPHCLYEINHDSKFCSYCGQPIKKEQLD